MIERCFLKIFDKIPFDYKVMGVAFFLWGVMNFTDGVLAENWLNIGKGLVALFIGGYYFFSRQQVSIRYKMIEEEEK
jgi:hypothetical protein